jgi:hypothetical protein
VTFDDPVEDGRRWQLDVTFLTSHWQCLYGCGCQGVRDTLTPERHEGCCSYGAHFCDAKDRDRVVRISKQLRPDEWQHLSEGRPLRRIDNVEDDGSVTSVVTEFGRSGWGEGGDDFAWWCTEAPEAFTGAEPVYRSLEPELRRTCGDAVYERLATYLDARMQSSMGPIAHPAERPVKLGPTRRRAARA